MTGAPEPPADTEADAPPRPARRRPRTPSLLDALLPIVVLIGLLALTIAFFGIDATNGPLQVALLLSADGQQDEDRSHRRHPRRDGRGRHHGDGSDLHPAGRRR